MADADSIIEVRDVGPVERLEIPIPAGGGVVVLRGLNGSGKSHSIAAVSALVGAKQKPSTRDGALGAQITGLGARLTVGRKSATAGEVEVTALDGEDPSLLVDPGLKDDEAADAQRIRALLRLARARVEVSAFAKLVGGDETLRELCQSATLTIEDVPKLAAAVKRDFERAARKHEQAAENWLAKAQGVLATIQTEGAVETVAESPEAARAAHTAAVREHSALQATLEERRKLAAAAKDAKAALAELGSEGLDDPDETALRLEQARSEVESLGNDGKPGRVEAARALEKQQRELVTDLELQLDRAKRALEAASADVVLQETATESRAKATEWVAELEREQRAARQRAALQQAVEAGAEVEDDDEAQLAELAAACERATADIEAWAVHSRTETLRKEARQLEDLSRESAEEGLALREAARGTEQVVLEAVRSVCGDDFEIHEGRLYVHTDRGREPFCELSMGERWRKALDIAVKAVGSHGLLVCRQEAYESLDPDNRAEVAAAARERGVVIITAEATNGCLRAEVE